MRGGLALLRRAGLKDQRYISEGGKRKGPLFVESGPFAKEHSEESLCYRSYFAAGVLDGWLAAVCPISSEKRLPFG